jgi:hypothetical protein
MRNRCVMELVDGFALLAVLLVASPQHVVPILTFTNLTR